MLAKDYIKKKTRARQSDESTEEVAPARRVARDEDHLYGFSTGEEDSSDEDDGIDDNPSAVDMGKLPTIAKDDAVVKQKLEKAKRHPVCTHYFIIIIIFRLMFHQRVNSHRQSNAG